MVFFFFGIFKYYLYSCTSASISILEHLLKFYSSPLITVSLEYCWNRVIELAVYSDNINHLDL